MNPGARPRRTIAALAGAAAVITGVTVLAVGGVGNEAEAEALQRFASCAELEAWGEQSMAGDGFGTDEFTAAGAAVDDSAGAEAAPAGDRQTAAIEQSADGVDGTGDLDTGGTNVIVEGVDELDLLDRIDGDVWLVASTDRLAILDLEAGERLASQEVGADPTISYDPDLGLVWVIASGPDDWSLVIRRLAVTSDSLDVEGTWEVDGSLVAARRIGGRLHLVATDGFHGTGGPELPFAGAPVPCDQVLHPEGPSQPAATLVATFEPEGPVEPASTTQVVGSGQFVHLTHDAVYLATPQWAQDAMTTGIHRFALDGLNLTGSGEVEGSLLNEFALSEHDGHLRVAVTHGGGMFFGGPAVDVGAPVGDGDVVTSGDSVNPDEPVSSDESVSSDEPVSPELLPVEPPTDMPPPGGREPGAESILNEIVVLDTEGDLDVVGRTDRFGKPWETIHGIRFVGEVAYAVTFLTTDPFYVVDLADPTAPTVVGELELPGFSSYLHPVDDDHVVGFGPDERGEASAKLFDVSDPTAPSVVDSVTLGSESAVTWDHHAFVSLGDNRFAIPASDRRTGLPDGCTDQDHRSQAQALEQQGELPCAHLDGYSVSAAITLEVADGSLREVERHEAPSASAAQRIIPSSAGWTFLEGGRLVLLDSSGAERSTLSLAD